MKRSVKGFNAYFKENKQSFIISIDNLVADVVYGAEGNGDLTELIYILNKFQDIFKFRLDIEYLLEKSDEIEAYNDHQADLQMEQYREERYEAKEEDKYIDSMFNSLL